MFKIFFALLTLLVTQNLYAHARWTLNGAVVPRSTNSGIKSGPCGGLARTATPKIFQAGSNLTVQWEETINHPGRFEIYFSPAADASFTLLKSVTDIQDDGNTPHSYSTSITLPNTACTDCTLQLIQVMTENPSSPTLYYSCADIQLTSGSASPTPTPAPAESCN